MGLISDGVIPQKMIDEGKAESKRINAAASRCIEEIEEACKAYSVKSIITFIIILVVGIGASVVFFLPIFGRNTLIPLGILIVVITIIVAGVVLSNMRHRLDRLRTLVKSTKTQLEASDR